MINVETDVLAGKTEDFGRGNKKPDDGVQERKKEAWLRLVHVLMVNDGFLRSS